ncbi:TetR/AcrR family transcriptional regulator [Halomonas organivorans]|uniref:TetR/AcrR family transcriptional repressor of nem operon n=1 Tax=Halomonas organivorans TaxID=257772 RepID=A0A7W5BV87_9GAMM|nr:TetR/AcrR family transcriptional regulator [Halomonas organivorans]MBB3139681.1 TetR/AcrR family transcriptional repressor of nem operon [Halomonas organivorans]
MARPQAFNTTEALHQAMNVFWHKGYEATSMADLLAATGLSKSSLYAAFGGKRELFVAAFDAYREAREREMRRMLAHRPAREAIEGFFRKIVLDAGDGDPSRGCMSINQAVEMAPRDPEIRGRVLQDFTLIEEALAEAIARGQAEGSVGDAYDARHLARLLVLAFPGLQIMVRAGSDRARLDDSLNSLLFMLDRDH